MKLFRRFEIFLNIQNSYQKFNFHESQSIERNWASIEVSFQSIRRESNTDWIKSRLQDIIHHHFDRLSKNQTYWILNFTWKIPDFEFLFYETIFFKLKYHYYNISMYIPIYTTISHEVVIIYVSLDWYSIMHNGRRLST